MSKNFGLEVNVRKCKEIIKKMDELLKNTNYPQPPPQRNGHRPIGIGIRELEKIYEREKSINSFCK